MKFFLLEIDTWKKLFYAKINLLCALNLNVSYTEEYLSHNKLNQQRKKFVSIFIFEIDSSVLWCKTVDYACSRKAFATRNNNWFVFR